MYSHKTKTCRVRLAFGLKNLKHDLIFLANDDVPTPTALVGKKIAPIFSDLGNSMPESLGST
jgi:glutaredoxin 2